MQSEPWLTQILRGCCIVKEAILHSTRGECVVAEAQTLSTYNANTLLIGQLVSNGVSSSLAADVCQLERVGRTAFVCQIIFHDLIIFLGLFSFLLQYLGGGEAKSPLYGFCGSRPQVAQRLARQLHVISGNLAPDLHPRTSKHHHNHHHFDSYAEAKMRVPPESYRLYKTLYAFAIDRLFKTWPGKISMLWLSFSSGYGCMWIFHRMGMKEELKELEELKQLEEIERMLERAGRLRSAAANHRRGLEEAESEERRLREKVREIESSRRTGNEMGKSRGYSNWFS